MVWLLLFEVAGLVEDVSRAEDALVIKTSTYPLVLRIECFRVHFGPATVLERIGF